MMQTFCSRFSFLSSVFLTWSVSPTLLASVPDVSYLHLELADNNKVITTPAGTDNIQWTVLFESSSPANLSWYNGQGLQLTSSILRSGKYNVTANEYSTTLTVRNLTVNDTGTFTLRAEANTHTENVNMWLNVQGKPTVVLYGPRQDYLLVNKTHKIECRSMAWPSPNITWLQRNCDSYPNCSKGFAPLTGGGYNQINAVTLISHQMYFANHSADITCVACNDFGCDSQSKTFLVSDDVRGLKVSGPTPVVQEDNAVLSCMASKYGYHSEIRWMYTKQNDSHSSRIFDSTSKFKLTLRESKFSYFLDLTIRNVSPDDAGIYYCMTSGGEEPLPDSKGKAFSLVVKSLQAPKFIPDRSNITKQSISMKKGEEVRIGCYVDATPAAEITWFQGDKQLALQKKSRVEFLDNNQLLFIRSAKAEDSGKYTCKVTNREGSLTGSSFLKIKDNEEKELPAAG